MFCEIQLRLFICLRKLQLSQKMFRKIQKLKTDIPQITSFSKKFTHFTVSAKYNNKLILLRKIQHKMLPEIQIFPKNAMQNTGNFVAQNTDFSEN